MARTITPEYVALTKEQQLYREDNDCTVKALALTTGISYAEAHKLLASLGRVNGKGFSSFLTREAVAHTGKRIRQVKVIEEIVHQYPGKHKNKLRATTHQPARFPGAWKNGKTYMAFTKGHVLAIVDGVVHDWTSEKSFYILNMWEVL